jgi:hypothetical protein
MGIFVLTATYELRVSRKATYVTTLMPMKKDDSKLYFPYLHLQIFFIQFLVTQKDHKRSL